MLIQSPQQEYRTWIFDGRRWQHYRPRSNDIVIATYPKSGTTWMQRIVGLLVFQTPEPKPIMQISTWIDRRFPQPIEAVVAQIEAQSVFEKGRWLHGQRLMSVAVAAIVMRVSATAVSCS
jgi:aryl sulfotransferase